MDNTFWATVALVIFVAAVFDLKVPRTISKSLDERANRIRNELEEARRLREEERSSFSPNSSASGKKPRRTRPDIVSAAKREADILLETRRGARPKTM